ncbi:hypothetical protein FGL86_06955 [Pistricoccus aurantiacus]|uniref:Type 4 fimbrial biogenesis protein PilX N-terminal domain-containing protein n=1 Tax=Pistricoccus aurantiacus TaxID=1883414 RepID=A0A5B8SP38_9GAMM|nr:PilX N-terminal domain-containing pilus assembly protein [Pistricoccus aurantiacus]QEA38839.1 hypothetical protein FGL86_06955 [Pistricoccus aurantiacus]
MVTRNHNQQGVALLVVLIMLIVVGLAAVTGAKDSQLQTKMSINSRAYEQAYYHAETSLAHAENKLQTETWLISDFDNSNGLFIADKGKAVLPRINASSSTIDIHAVLKEKGRIAKGIDNNIIGFYLVEYLGRVGRAPLNPTNEKNAGDLRLNAFRITALGQAGLGNKAWAVIQSELRLKPF